MSCFIVTKKCIDSILSVRFNYDLIHEYCYLKSEIDNLLVNYGEEVEEGLTRVGNDFLKLNIEAYNDRYNREEEKEQNYTFTDINCSLAQSIKSLNCLIYQCLDKNNYKENETFIKLEKLQKILVDAFLYTNEEYNKAQWCIA